VQISDFLHNSLLFSAYCFFFSQPDKITHPSLTNDGPYFHIWTHGLLYFCLCELCSNNGVVFFAKFLCGFLRIRWTPGTETYIRQDEEWTPQGTSRENLPERDACRTLVDGLAQWRGLRLNVCMYDLYACLTYACMNVYLQAKLVTQKNSPCISGCPRGVHHCVCHCAIQTTLFHSAHAQDFWLSGECKHNSVCLFIPSICFDAVFSLSLLVSVYCSLCLLL